MRVVVTGAAGFIGSNLVHGLNAVGIDVTSKHVAGDDRAVLQHVLRSALEQMIPNHDHLFDSVLGVGLMLGIKMKTDSRAFVNWLRGQGLLTVAAGDNVMRILPPLVIDESHIREFVEGLSAAAAQYEVPAAAA